MVSRHFWTLLDCSCKITRRVYFKAFVFCWSATRRITCLFHLSVRLCMLPVVYCVSDSVLSSESKLREPICSGCHFQDLFLWYPR